MRRIDLEALKALLEQMPDGERIKINLTKKTCAHCEAKFFGPDRADFCTNNCKAYAHRAKKTLQGSD